MCRVFQKSPGILQIVKRKGYTAKNGMAVARIWYRSLSERHTNIINFYACSFFILFQNDFEIHADFWNTMYTERS